MSIRQHTVRPDRSHCGLSQRSATAVLCVVFAVTAGLAAIPSGATESGSQPVKAAGESAAARPVPGRVVRYFEQPDGPYEPGHRGVDLQAMGGQVVRAALSGHVSFSGTVARIGWVTVDHGGGLRTTYGPLTDRADADTRVAAGAPIGRVDDGATHLDWGANVAGSYIDPLTLLAPWTLRLTKL